MKRHSTLWLVLGVILLAVLPLWIVPSLMPDIEPEKLFSGADDKAKNLIGEISPEYQPWFSPLFESSSPEISTLLFSLQAALGAGVIGYYLGVARTREKMRRESGSTVVEGDHPPTKKAESGVKGSESC